MRPRLAAVRLELRHVRLECAALCEQYCLRRLVVVAEGGLGRPLHVVEQLALFTFFISGRRFSWSFLTDACGATRGLHDVDDFIHNSRRWFIGRVYTRS